MSFKTIKKESTLEVIVQTNYGYFKIEVNILNILY